MEKILRMLCSMNQQSLLKLMSRFLIEQGYNVKSSPQWIVAEGDIPIALVAHLDTVFTVPPVDIFYDPHAEVMWSPDGLGADDRAGVAAIYKIIKDGYKPHVILTTDEEKGGIGAQALVNRGAWSNGTQTPDNLKPKCPLENLKAIFQLDRHGYNDCVFYDCDNPEFTKFVEGFGFEFSVGSFSDISILAPAWGVAAANLSVGYENEHTEIEFLELASLKDTIDKVEKILAEADNMPTFTYIERDIFESCLMCQKRTDSDCVKIQFAKDKNIYKLCNNCYSVYQNYFIKNPDDVRVI